MARFDQDPSQQQSPLSPLPSTPLSMTKPVSGCAVPTDLSSLLDTPASREMLPTNQNRNTGASSSSSAASPPLDTGSASQTPVAVKNIDPKLANMILDEILESTPNVTWEDVGKPAACPCVFLA